MIPRVSATRYVTPLREGGSLPGIVEADDLGTYVVKFRGAGQGLRVLVAEVLVGGLARRLGIRVPDMVAVDLDPRIAKYEADEEVQDLLNASLGLNLGSDFLPGAFGYDAHCVPDADEAAAINVRPGAMSSLRPSSEFGKDWHERLREAEVQKISVRRLDGLFDEAVDGIVNPRVYLKLDTQGYDLQAVAGAGDRLPEIAGMQSEVACVPIYDGMPRLPDQIAAYESAGFEITGMFPVTRHRASLRVIEFDVTMVRPDAVGPRGLQAVNG